LLQRSLPHCRAHTIMLFNRRKGISPPIHSIVRSHRLRCSMGPAAVASAESRYRIATSPTRATSGSISAVRTTTVAHRSDGWDLKRSACRADTPVHRRMLAITFLHQDGRCSLSHHHIVVRGARTVRTPDTCSESLKAPPGMYVAMLGPSGLNGWTPTPVHVFATGVRDMDRAAQPRVTGCPTAIAPAILCAFRCLSDVLAKRNQTHLGWSKMGSNNYKNCRGDGIAMEEASRKTRKAWCPNSDWHDNVEKERDT
jgi:hypothetical protein